jgi:hypothetical protein
MQPAPQLAESAAQERVLRCAERLAAHDREAAALAATRLELVAALARAREAAEAEQALALEAFPVLPRELTRIVFGLLPASMRLRCREVCKPWLAFLEERRLWWHLDLSWSNEPEQPTEALLKAASIRAGGQLQVLDVSRWVDLTAEMLLSVVRENAEALVELRAWGAINKKGGRLPQTTRQNAMIIVTAAPLQLFQCDLRCTSEEAPAVLNNAHPFESLRVQTIDIRAEDTALLYAADAILAAAATHGSLKRLFLMEADLSTAATLDALVDLAIARRFSAVGIAQCSFPAAPLPALTRMIAHGALEEFNAWPRTAGELLADAQSVPAFFEALKRLEVIYFFATRFEEHARLLLTELSRSTSLTLLTLSGAQLPTRESQLALSEGLAQLVSGCKTLTNLGLSFTRLSRESLQSLFAVVGSSNELRNLRLRDNGIDAETARDVILPAVKLNTSLRTLVFDQPDIPELVEAEALVKARNC